jgi:hypothetical protein
MVDRDYDSVMVVMVVVVMAMVVVVMVMVMLDHEGDQDRLRDRRGARRLVKHRHGRFENSTAFQFFFRRFIEFKFELESSRFHRARTCSFEAVPGGFDFPGSVDQPDHGQPGARRLVLQDLQGRGDAVGVLAYLPGRASFAAAPTAVMMAVGRGSYFAGGAIGVVIAG